MGAITSLRSEALAYRAREDTNLQVSGQLGTINRTFGGEIVKVIDQLQGVIGSRTTAYNGLVGKVNQALQGQGGVAEQQLQWGFDLASLIISTTQLLSSDPSDTPGYIASLTQKGLELVAIISGAVGVRASLEAITFDYQKMLSQLGLSPLDPTQNVDNVPGADDVRHLGAKGLQILRDSTMLSYKPLDNTWTGPRGYVGSLSRK